MFEKTFFDPETNTTGFLVIIDESLPIATGGLRITPGVSLDETRELARCMDEKFRLYRFPISGAKSGLCIPVHLNIEQRLKAIGNFGRAISFYLKDHYILGEDLGASPSDVAVLYKSAGINRQIASKNILKKARVLTPLIYLPDLIVRHLPSYSVFGPKLAGSIMASMLDLYREKVGGKLSLSLMGVGSIGKSLLSSLNNEKFKIVAISDIEKTMRFNKSLSPQEALQFISADGLIDNRASQFAQQLSPKEILKVPCDIFVPAAVGDLINEENYESIGAKIIFEAANNVTLPSVVSRLVQRGTMVFPDFVVNSGISTSFGIIVTSKKMIWSKRHLEKMTKDLMLSKFSDLLNQSMAENISMRELIYKDWQK